MERNAKLHLRHEAILAYFSSRAHRHGRGCSGQKDGHWGQAINIPGLRALQTVAYGDVSSVSCASPGNCAAGGWYYDNRGSHFQGFVALETNGAWRTAIEVPGLAALNTGGEGGVTSVSCPPAGNCVAGGDYRDSHELQGFVTR